ncbi:MAG: hypothetical protein ACP5XB_14630 [Isosphaeraceae bacterium]
MSLEPRPTRSRFILKETKASLQGASSILVFYPTLDAAPGTFDVAHGSVQSLEMKRQKLEKLSMRFAGRVYKDGKFWLAEIPILDAMTQGRTRSEVFMMVADLLETLVDRPGFKVHVHPGADDHFEVSAPNAADRFYRFFEYLIFAKELRPALA